MMTLTKISTAALAVSFTMMLLPAQSTHSVSGSFGPQTYPFGWTSSARTTEVRNGTITVSQFDPALGRLCGIKVTVRGEASTQFLGVISPRSWPTGINANMRLFWRVTPPGGSAVEAQRFFNQSMTLAAGRTAANMSYGPLADSESATLPSTAFGRYIGTSTVRMPLRMTFVMEATSSGGSMNWQFTPATKCDVTVEYSYTTSPPASVLPYGQGCPGTGGLVPKIAASGLPLLGSTNFSLDLSDARPNSAAGVLVSFGSAVRPISGCTLLLADPVIPLSPITTNGSGAGSTPVPIPNDAGLLGLHVYAQYLVSDPAGALHQIYAMSAGVDLRVGC
ncbi:MAG: choice-of-anchor E domain-containing protein [bacterium]|nr:choice-of-anchor E domain-containing protein [bacterium]